jgi:hypothetical protein
MANKHVTQEPGTKPVIWARSEPDLARSMRAQTQPCTRGVAGSFKVFAHRASPGTDHPKRARTWPVR